MTHPMLQPMPMTPAEIHDLVERSRAAMVRSGRSGALARISMLFRARCAARYRMLTRCDIKTAARVFRVDDGAVTDAWRRAYPGLPMRFR